MTCYNNEIKIDNYEQLKGKKIMVIGGTGSFGQEFTKLLLTTDIEKIYIYSRDELKQSQMNKKFNNNRLQFFIGDIRDKTRLNRAMNRIDYVVHAAAQKHVPSCEYNPFEAIKTNVIGSENIINAAIDNNVKKVIELSTDKAVEPINLYGYTKGCMEKIFINANSYNKNIKFSIVRYGNVFNSRGSIFQLWNSCIKNDLDIPLTDENMTRFHITLEYAVKFVLEKLLEMEGVEIFIPKLPSIRINDLANIIIENKKNNIKIIGKRQGEKLHEKMISELETGTILEGDIDFTIYPKFSWFDVSKIKKNKNKRIMYNFNYISWNNKYLNDLEIRSLINENN